MAPPLLYSWFRSPEEATGTCSNAWDTTTNSTRSSPLTGQSISCNVIRDGGWCWETDNIWFEAATKDILSACRSAEANPQTTFSCQSYSYSPISGQCYSFMIVALCFSLWY